MVLANVSNMKKETWKATRVMLAVDLDSKTVVVSASNGKKDMAAFEDVSLAIHDDSFAELAHGANNEPEDNLQPLRMINEPEIVVATPTTFTKMSTVKTSCKPFLTSDDPVSEDNTAASSSIDESISMFKALIHEVQAIPRTDPLKTLRVGREPHGE